MISQYFLIAIAQCVTKLGMFNILNDTGVDMVALNPQEGKLDFMHPNDVKLMKFKNSFYFTGKDIQIDKYFLSTDAGCKNLLFYPSPSNKPEWRIFEHSNNKGQIYNLNCSKCAGQQNIPFTNHSEMVLLDCDDNRTYLSFEAVIVDSKDVMHEASLPPSPPSILANPLIGNYNQGGFFKKYNSTLLPFNRQSNYKK